MIYLKSIRLPSDADEIRVIQSEARTCFVSFYPFKIFPDKGLSRLTFDTVTMLYGGNGSGKSTLINLIAEKIGADRFSDFNDSPHFPRYVGMTQVEYYSRPSGAVMLSSDDVFDYLFSARSVNERLDEKRSALFDKYVEAHNEIHRNPDIGILHGLDDYERWSETREILSRRRTQSQYVKSRVAREIDLYSNGETAMRYFIDRIPEGGICLLDEPENSLSVERQIELADYLAATARASRTQFIIATHSPILLSMAGATVYDLDSYPVAARHWTELENVRRYYEFFASHRDEFEEE